MRFSLIYISLSLKYVATCKENNIYVAYSNENEVVDVELSNK